MDASRASRWIALAGAALVAAATLAHGWIIAVDDPQRPPLTTVFAIERDGDYAAWTRVFAPRDHVNVMYSANGSVDRVLLVRLGEVDDVLRGAEPATAVELPPGRTIGPHTIGRFHFEAPIPDCPPPSGGCIDETMPVLVWLKGDAWQGATRADAQHYVVLSEAWDGPRVEGERTEGPVRPDLVRTPQRLVAAAPFWLGLAALAGAAALLAGLAHLLLELRRPRDAPLVPSIPRTESTETMLMLARLTALYVDGIRRSFLVSLVAIVGIAAATMFFGLPPMLARVSEHFRHQWELQELHVALFVLAPVVVALTAALLWGASYARVWREVRAWRRRARGFEEEAARILGA